MNERRLASAQAAAASLGPSAVLGTSTPSQPPQQQASSSSSPARQSDDDAKSRLASRLGTTAHAMDATAQAVQDTTRPSGSLASDTSLRVVQRNPKAKTASKAQRSDTGISKQRDLPNERSSEAKRINKAARPQCKTHQSHLRRARDCKKEE